MQEIMFYLGIGIFIYGLYYSFKIHTKHDINQAALLPFADDPDAAKKITQMTGMPFDNVVNGVEFSPDAAVGSLMDEFIA